MDSQRFSVGVQQHVIVCPISVSRFILSFPLGVHLDHHFIDASGVSKRMRGVVESDALMEDSEVHTAECGEEVSTPYDGMTVRIHDFTGHSKVRVGQGAWYLSLCGRCLITPHRLQEDRADSQRISGKPIH